MEASSTLLARAEAALASIGVKRDAYVDGTLFVRSAIGGARIAKLREADGTSADETISRSVEASIRWRDTAPATRADLVRRIADNLRRHREDLAILLSIETGKLLPDSLAEADRAILRCDHAVGLLQASSATNNIAGSGYRMQEAWHPLGVTGCITSFSEPVAQFAAHAFATVMCGNSVIWKPSEKASLTASAMFEIIQRTAADFPAAQGLFRLLVGGRDIGKLLCDDFRVSLVSAAGSMNTGRAIGLKLSQRFARSVLYLGGNNAAIVCPSADLKLALPLIVEAIIYRTGQGCGNVRRLFVHRDVYETVTNMLKTALANVPVGDPLLPDSAMGPLIDRSAFENMHRALQESKNERGRVTGGERVAATEFPAAYYVRPALVEMPAHAGPMLRETLAPILYVMQVRSLAEAIELNNATDAGLGAAIFTQEMREADLFLGAGGIDCGMASVNRCLVHDEIGLPFGGDKSSGGGRLSGTDCTTHMRRSVVSMNLGGQPELRPHMRFDMGLSAEPVRQPEAMRRAPGR